MTSVLLIFTCQWYRYDDDKYVYYIFLELISSDIVQTTCRVTHSTLGECLASQAYMCFYVKKHIDYKPYMTPSYVVTREQEAVKEKEREREREAARQKEVEEAILNVL